MIASRRKCRRWSWLWSEPTTIALVCVIVIVVVIVWCVLGVVSYGLHMAKPACREGNVTSADRIVSCRIVSYRRIVSQRIDIDTTHVGETRPVRSPTG